VDDAVMDETPPRRPDNAIVLTGRAWVRPDDVDLSFSRSGGPGGQHVNKVNTRATLHVLVEAIEGLPSDARERLRRLAGQRLTNDDAIVLHSEATRSQRRNRDDVIDRLRDLVREAAQRPKIRRASRPSRARIERRSREKKQRGERERDRRPPDW